jgi:hypothetical protein
MYQPFTTVLLRRLGYQPTRLREIMKHAELFGVSQNQAIGARRSYLWKEWDYYLNVDCGVMTWDVICKPTMMQIIKELFQLSKDLYFRNRKTDDNEINENMVSRAKMVPVTDLVEFANGRATAWCHDDSRPSLYVATRINKIVCPACGDKRFDSIDILMTRDGLSFPEAVKRLCNQ